MIFANPATLVTAAIITQSLAGIDAFVTTIVSGDAGQGVGDQARAFSISCASAFGVTVGA